ncbi:MAG: PqqD family peptide modification chaperone [Candidatus Omnitrophota bacterium]|nr:PqqD family peptide modification chaperone [Candidatus Omnitrophota bacterium]
MDTQTRTILKPQLVLREEFDDWAVLFDPDTGRAFGLNPIGVFICKRLDGIRTAGDIATQLAGEYREVTPEAGKEVHLFIDFLVRLDLANVKELS